MMCDLNFLDSYQLSLGQYRENGLSLVITTQYVLHKLFRLNPPHIRHSDKINREPQVIFKRVLYVSESIGSLETSIYIPLIPCS